MITPAAVLSALFLFFYLILTDFPVSAQRAVCMFWLRLGADVSGRTYDEPTAIAAAALMILCQNPLYLLDSGFLLSFGAAVSVCLLKWANVGGKQFGIWLWLCMLPLTMLFYYEVSFCGILLNLLVLVPLGLVLFLGLAGGILGSVVPVLGTILLTPVGVLLGLYARLCAWCVQLPFASRITGCPSWWQIGVYAAGLFFLLYYRKRNMKARKKNSGYRKLDKKHLLYSGAGVCLVMILMWRPPVVPSVTMLDVGQGDGLVIRQGYSALLVDGGSTTVSKVGRYRIVPFLKYMGIRHIERIFLTHPDADHMNGLEEVLDMIQSRELDMSVGGLVVPDWLREQADEVRLLEQARQLQIPVTYAVRGQTYTLGKIRFHILHPGGKTYETDSNAGSLTFHMQTDTFSMLFTGDLEGEGETEVCREQIESDILKVAHHGSKNASSKEFLDRVNPKLALISSGKGNRYGHPAEETVKRLEETGCFLYMTMDHGAVTVSGTKRGLTVRTFK